MSYQLGIDFGTTFTAAVVRRAEGTGDTEVVPLGGRGGAVSSVLHLARDGRVTVGEAAASLAGIDPTRVVRDLKRRVGDAAPVMLGGQPWAAEELSARLVRWVVDRVVEKEGEPPVTIALAHPVSWAPHTLERLAAALAGQDLGVTFVAAPRAVAHAAVGAAEAGAMVAIHDFGGGRFDAAVLRRAGTPGGGFAVLGVPEAIDDLGGLDLDELVWQHVRTSLPDDVTPVARVRRACTLAKETLSSENEVVVRIRYGDFRGAVRLDRPTFEGLIAPHVDRTVDALRRTIAAAGVEPGQLTALLLVGGSARIPLLARTVTEQLGCVPAVHGDEDLVARGAVFALSAQTAAAEAPTVVLAVPAVDAPTTPLLLPATVEPASPAPAEPQAPRRPGTRGRAAAVLDPGGRRMGGRSLPRTLVGVGAVLVAALVLVALFRPDGPLDPPLDPGAGNATHFIGPAEVATAPTAGVPGPNSADLRTEVDADAAPTVRPAAVDTRESVTTTPPALPSPSNLPDGIRAGSSAGREAPPTAMTPPVPPSPAAPVV
ncbi:MAG TPA: Hsp70 family protein [Pseudonocardia sp.]|nr:Hsp70 family protein [Pseudonocardia sp.]